MQKHPSPVTFYLYNALFIGIIRNDGVKSTRHPTRHLCLTTKQKSFNSYFNKS